MTGVRIRFILNKQDVGLRHLYMFNVATPEFPRFSTYSCQITEGSKFDVFLKTHFRYMLHPAPSTTGDQEVSPHRKGWVSVREEQHRKGAGRVRLSAVE